MVIPSHHEDKQCFPWPLLTVESLPVLLLLIKSLTDWSLLTSTRIHYISNALSHALFPSNPIFFHINNTHFIISVYFVFVFEESLLTTLQMLVSVISCKLHIQYGLVWRDLSLHKKRNVIILYL